MEDAGASAVVFHSLFEEQIRHDRHELQFYLDQGTESYAEALTYFPDPRSSTSGRKRTSNTSRRPKQPSRIPIIGSLNGSTLRRLDEVCAADRASRAPMRWS